MKKLYLGEKVFWNFEKEKNQTFQIFKKSIFLKNSEKSKISGNLKITFFQNPNKNFKNPTKIIFFSLNVFYIFFSNFFKIQYFYSIYFLIESSDPVDAKNAQTYYQTPSEHGDIMYWSERGQ